MLSERALSTVVSRIGDGVLRLQPAPERRMPVANLGRKYMLYAHVPFCERLCPYCSFNRFPYDEARAIPYFENMRQEMLMLSTAGYDFHTLYIGGGTPTINIDELCRTIDFARELFSIEEVSTETNPNHLIPEVLEPLSGRIHRLSVGVQSSNDDLLKAMDRYEKYGSSTEIFKRLEHVAGYPFTFNVDMIFNFPAQTEDMLIDDVAFVLESGCSQTTFYPLMASPSVERKLAETVGKVDYGREQRFYDIIWRGLV
ncbi:MAG: radical SAM protein, partial [Eggerthellaceae bacterium]|nr:radical SAM protein [Eggerthellaceae bacterium]